MMFRRLLLAGLIVLTAALAEPVSAQPQAQAPKPAELLETWDREAERITERLDQGEFTPEELEEMRRTLEAHRSGAPTLLTDVDARLEPLRSQLEALGPLPEEGASESAEISRERAVLNDRIAEIEALKRRADQTDARAKALIDRIFQVRREVFTRQLLSRGPSLLESGVPQGALAALGRTVGGLGAEVRERLDAQRMDAPLVARLLGPFLLLGVALFFLISVRKAVLERFRSRVTEEMPASRRITTAFGITAARLLLPAVALTLTMIGIWNTGLLGPQGEAVLAGFGRTAALVIGAYALGGAFFSPNSAKLRISRLNDRGARRAHRYLMALAGVVGLDRTLVVRGESIGVAAEGLVLLNTVLLTLAAVALWLLIRACTLHQLESASVAVPDGEEDAEESEPELRGLLPMLSSAAGMLLRLVAIAAPLLALAGYYAASRYVFYPPVFSIALVGFFFLLFVVVRESFEQLITPQDEARRQQANRIRLIPVLMGFLLACAAVPLVALIWGAQVSDIVTVWRRIGDGFAVGEVVISPLDFVGFLLVFSIGYVLTRVAQGIISRSVLPLTGLDIGGRAAITAGIGYVGVIVSALVAIATAGLDLSNLAIVAGALSVGIGFGLQNIVNNFVSGLILLIERPIKAGDWVELSSGMGYVKKVNVRSTEIQTFDRASLFVPNSELISSTVTNWTHADLNGRIIVKVGVAYGTDVRKVEEILLEIARSHPMMLRRPAPYVLFRGFGESSLDFEIRGILRDVNWILNVQSDINFEIAKRFEEEGVEVPFRQTDLHLRNHEEIAESFGRAFGRGGARRRPAQKSDKGPGEGSAPAAPPSAGERPAGYDSDAADGEPDR